MSFLAAQELFEAVPQRMTMGRTAGRHVTAGSEVVGERGDRVLYEVADQVDAVATPRRSSSSEGIAWCVQRSDGIERYMRQPLGERLAGHRRREPRCCH